MPLSHPLLFALAAALLATYIGGSEVVERSPRWARFGRSRFSYALALGVYATTWTLFGSVGFAASEGYDFLAIYFGVTLSCIAIPFLWAPVAELVDRYRLGSVADLFAFRYQSRTLGALVSIFMVAGLLPYIALQLRAVAAGAAMLAGDEASETVGYAYAILLSTFAVALGVRYADGRAHRPGLVATLAFESIFKLFALLFVGLAALYFVFGGFGGLHQHLEENPNLIEQMTAPVMGDSWMSLVFVTFCAAFLLPRQFFVAFVQRPDPQSLHTARWALPLYLFAINLPVPILYWAGQHVAGPGVRPDVYVLVAVQSSPALQVLAFLGAVSAASAMILVSSIALSGMVATYLVPPLLLPTTQSLLTRWAVFRRTTIVGVIIAGLLIDFMLPRTRSLVDLGLASFLAVTHLLPGLIGTLFWRRATREGVIWGLVVGAGSWAVLTATPLFGVELDVSPLYGVFGFAADSGSRGPTIWLSITMHVFVFIGMSLLTTRSTEEKNASEACREPRVKRLLQVPDSSEALLERLTSYLGKRMAIDEIYEAAAAADVNWPPRDRPELLRLISELEGRLSERIGPLAARTYVQGGRPLRANALAERLRAFRELDLIEREQRTSPANAARRYLSVLMSELPVGVCTVDDHGDVLVWNAQLEKMSGLREDDICGHPMSEIPAPWWPLFDELAHQPSGSVIERKCDLGDRTVELRAQTATIPGEPEEGRAFVVEDITELRQLERHVAHKDRLSSIGTLASGVAHEVGNPLTGILMVAKNLAADPDADDAKERLGIIVDEAQRIHGIVKSLLTFSRREEATVELQAIPVAGAVRSAAELALIESDGCEIDLDLSEDAPVMATPDGLTQVLVNLVNNARQASPPESRIRVRTRVAGSAVRIEVDDEGPGIPDDLVPKVFEPFFTTKPDGKGTGLGLSVSRQIVERFGGSLQYEPRIAGGSRFTVTLRAYEN
jgi:PAS domain S-box-containing protein